MSDEDGDYKVGRGRPPLATQFKPGQSGNPRGRPKRRRGRSVLDEVLQQKVSATANGQRVSVTRERAFLLGLINDALKGDKFARRELNKHLLARGSSAANPSDEALPGIRVAFVTPPQRTDGT